MRGVHLKFILYMPFADLNEIRVKLNDHIIMLRYKEFQEEFSLILTRFSNKLENLFFLHLLESFLKTFDVFLCFI